MWITTISLDAMVRRSGLTATLALRIWAVQRQAESAVMLHEGELSNASVTETN